MPTYIPCKYKKYWDSEQLFCNHPSKKLVYCQFSICPLKNENESDTDFITRMNTYYNVWHPAH